MKVEEGLMPALLILFCVALLCLASCSLGDWMLRKEAVENNAAEWRCNPKTGEKEFVWLTAKPKAEKE